MKVKKRTLLVGAKRHTLPFRAPQEELLQTLGSTLGPEYLSQKRALYEKRVSTFKKLPSSHPHQPETLAALGFFLKKGSWSLYCFACAHSISYLVPGEDVGERHILPLFLWGLFRAMIEGRKKYLFYLVINMCFWSVRKVMVFVP